MNSLYLTFLVCFLTAVGFSQPYTFRSYSLAEGLPQSQVWCGLSDSRGFLWFGTQGGGLSRFDGLQFETFTTASGLSSNFILSLYQEKDYRIWVGTNRGLCHYDGRQVKALEGQELPVRCMAQLPNGVLLAGTTEGIYKVKTDSLVPTAWPLKEELDQSIVYTLAQKGKQWWAGTSSGLWEVYPNCRQVASGYEVFDLATSKDGLWMAVYGRGVYRYTDRVEAVYTAELVRRPMSLFRDSSGTLYIGTQDQGVMVQDTTSTWGVSPAEGQDVMQNNVRDIFQDQAGHLWITSSGGGVACRTQQNFQHFDRADGLRGNRIYALHSDTAQQLWMAVSRRGLQVLDSTGFSAPATQPPFPGIKCKTICGDSLGQIWVGSEGDGIAVLDTAGWYKIQAKDGLPSNWIVKMLADTAGHIWGATYSNGLFQIVQKGYRDYEIRRFGRSLGLPDMRINALAISPDYKIWFGTFSGEVGSLHNGKVERLFTGDNGLPQASIRSIAFDRYGQIWLGTKGSGVFFAKLNTAQASFTRLSEVHSTTSENIYLMLSGPDSHIWAGSESGVDKIELDTIGQVAQVRHYNRNDGFLGIETCHDAAIANSDGSIWFGTMNGLTRYRPGESALSCITPNLHFTQVDLFYKPLEETSWADYVVESGGLKPGLELPYRQNHLSFSFRAVAQMQPEELRYRWRLEGADSDWSPASSTQSVNYANLPAGEYRFMVQASVGDCPWSTPLVAPFAIAEPFWQASWFAPAVIVAAIILISLIAWLVVRRVKRREKAHREDLKLQNRLLQLEQKALQLQMNPHFIFNALTGIQSLIAGGSYPKARMRINEFAKLMRSTLYNARKPFITLQEEADTLYRYLEIEQFCQAQPFTFEIVLPEGIDSDEVSLPPMLLQPFVENAVLHGISHLDYAGHITIEFTLEEELLHVCIKDNGVGRKKAAQLQEERKPGHQSVALKVTKERLEAMRGHDPYESLKITDIMDTKGNIKGTKVEVVLPIEHAY